VGAVSYGADANEFGVEVLSMKKWTEEGLDAVFLPGYADSGVTLARALRHARPDLRLLGSNGWHDPVQLAQAAPDLEGLVFVDGFFLESQRSATRQFVNAYRGTYQNAPDILEAQAYDAAAMRCGRGRGRVPM
jgi:ABC-type branched-subunit amino acid transport system substrate-binding protein